MTRDSFRIASDHDGSGPIAKRLRPPIVLLVEDEPDVAEMYREWPRHRYDVELAHTGGEAFDRVDESVDVVLLDRDLPDMLGRVVLEEIRQQDLPCQVVVVSAIEPSIDVLDLGFDDYLTEPTSKSDLTSAVERSLTRMTYAAKHREFTALV